MTYEHRNVQSVGKEVRDVPVVAGGAWRGDAGLPAVLREGRGGARAVHGLERPTAHVRDRLSALGEVGEAVKGYSARESFDVGKDCRGAPTS